MDREVAQLHGRLQGRMVDPTLRLASATRLGKALALLSRYDDAIRCLDEALTLATQLNLHTAEADARSSLGLCHFRRGDFVQAIALQEQAMMLFGDDRTPEEERVWLEACHLLGFGYSAIGHIELAVSHAEQALEAAVRLEDRRRECRQRGFLGLYASYQGDARRALDFDLRALQQAHQLKRPRDIVCHLGFLTEVCCTQLGDHDACIRYAEEALRIEAEISSPLNGSWCNQWLAVARGLNGDLAGARRAAEEACRFDEPLNNQNSLAVLGVVRLRQGDKPAARQALDAAVRWADGLLVRCDRNWEALDARGLALCGLALLDGQKGFDAAIATFQAARRVTAGAGVVRRILRQLDLLMPTGPAALLASLRQAAGEATG
jgi:tetratricopeptide (TPR) repeat protein